MKKISTDLLKVLAAAPSLTTAWKNLTPIARRDFMSWIESAKQPETHRRRVEKACSMLANGKRRICCYAIVPMNLYKTLGSNPKAKAQWKALTPNERRDFVRWINSVKETKMRKERAEKTCDILDAGKRHP